MQYKIIIFTIITLFNSCQRKKDVKKKTNIKIEKKTKLLDNNCAFKISFNDFKKNAISNDIKELKKCLNFPFKDGNIWHLVFSQIENDNYDPSIPFTERDFDKYYNNIFTPDFVKCLGLVDLKLLIKDKNFETKSLSNYNKENVEIKNYYMNAEINDVDKKLILSMNYNFFDDEGRYETSYIYYFNFENCILILNRIVTAG